MRISFKEGDPDYRNPADFKVTLEGVAVDRVIMADDEAGTVIQQRFDEVGQPLYALKDVFKAINGQKVRDTIIDHSRPIEEFLRGKVRIIDLKLQARMEQFGGAGGGTTNQAIYEHVFVPGSVLVDPDLPVVIGIAGRKGAGKDTAAEGLAHALGYQVIGFADPLKGMLGVLLAYRGVTPAMIDRMLNGDLKEVPCRELEGKSPRQAMQTLGTEWGRDLVGPDLWVNAASDRVAASPPGSGFVFKDTRFPNEKAFVQTNGGPVIGVERFDGAADPHVSEQDLGCDFHLSNLGTKEALQQSVVSVVKSFAKKGKAA